MTDYENGCHKVIRALEKMSDDGSIEDEYYAIMQCLNSARDLLTAHKRGVASAQSSGKGDTKDGD